MRISKVIALAPLVVVSGSAEPVAFRKIADSSTIAPGGSRAFTSFQAPVVHSGRIAFHAHTETGVNPANGIYVWDGQISLVAQLGSSAPDGAGVFTGFPLFGAVAINGTRVGFQAETADRVGIYVYEPGNLRTGVDNTEHTSDGGDINNLLYPTLDANGIAVTGFIGLSWSAVLKAGATAHRLFGGAEVSFERPVLANGVVAVILDEFSANEALAVASIQEPAGRRIVSRSTVAPNQAATFTSIPSMNLHGEEGKFFFKAEFSGGAGVYSVNPDGSNLQRVADTTMTFAGQRIPFISSYAYSSGTLLIDTGFALVRLQSGRLDTLVESFGELDGKTITGYDFTRSLHRGLFALLVHFLDGSIGIYSANVGMVTPVELTLDPASLSYGSGSFSFRLVGEPGKRYEIQSAVSLPFDAANTQSLVTLDYTEPRTITDSAADGVARFYRAVER